jgi:hypothetical protein
VLGDGDVCSIIHACIKTVHGTLKPCAISCDNSKNKLENMKQVTLKMLFINET